VSLTAGARAGMTCMEMRFVFDGERRRLERSGQFRFDAGFDIH
jgi:hypothetical protein